MTLIDQHRARLIDICSSCGVHRIFAFGSIVNGHFDPETSDLDFLVEMLEMPPMQRGQQLIALWEVLEQLFDRKVDLVTQSTMRNPYLQKAITDTKVLLYERQSEKVLG